MHLLLSFVIPCFNADADMLSECVGSLTALRHDAIEILIVDDGSTDDQPSAESLPTNEKSSLRIISQPHAGVGAARMQGLHEAKGEYVFFIDADDAVLTDVWNTTLLPLLQSESPDVVTLRHTSHTPAVGTTDKHNVVHYTSGADYMLRNNVRGACWNYIVRRTVAMRTEFSKGVKYSEDERWTALMLLSAGHVVATDIVAYYYRLHSASATGRRDSATRQTRIADSLATICYLDAVAGTMHHGTAHDALRRRIAQLTMDFIWNVSRWTRSPRHVFRQAALLRERRLLPLPVKRYTTKYYIFSIITKIL